METEVSRLQAGFRQLEQDAAEGLAGLRDPGLSTLTEDGRTVRQVLYDLTDSYRQRIEQLLWTKWGQRIPRRESIRAIAELQGCRAQFAAYFNDLRDDQFDAPSAPAENASARDVITAALEEEAQAMALILTAIESAAPQEEESHG